MICFVIIIFTKLSNIICRLTFVIVVYNQFYYYIDQHTVCLPRPVMNTLKKQHLNYVSFSATSIKMQHDSKIDGVLNKLHNRKKELIENLQKTQTKIKANKSQNTNLSNLKTVKQKQQSKSYQIRKSKYKNKIETQINQKNKLQKSVQALNQKIFNLALSIQNNEIKLKDISETIKLQFQKGIGLDHQGCQKQRKWIYHRIITISQQILNPKMSMSKVLCKFYASENNITQFKYLPPPYSIFDYIIKMRLVNKLYGTLIHNEMCKSFRSARKLKIDIQKLIQSQQDQLQQKPQLQESCLQQQRNTNSQQQQDNLNRLSQQPTERQNYQEQEKQQIWASDHKCWLQILKLMKTLQKLESVPESIQNIMVQYEIDYTVNTVQIHKKIKVLVQSSIKIKKQTKQKYKAIQQIKLQKQQILQQISIKKQFIDSLILKLEALQKLKQKEQISQIRQQNQYNNQQNPQKVMEAQKKQLKEVQQAINYFNIKKNTANRYSNAQNKSKQHLKSVEDISTNFLSPHKSSVDCDRFVSPDFTKRRQLSSKKYSLKKLLSPPKYEQTEKKRKAWK